MKISLRTQNSIGSEIWLFGDLIMAWAANHIIERTKLEKVDRKNISN